ncbi:MAG: hypothetical protein R3321_04920, partial [Nitrososphaeraceae archaeon]|nr:hypothetical protein [Nitrososphaeraceae archaeon]
MGDLGGHLQAIPFFFEKVEGHLDRPYFIQKLMNAATRYYNSPKYYLIRLSFLQTSQKRSERRESIVNVLRLFLYYTDIATHQIGTFLKNGALNPLRLKFIQDKLNMGYKRIWRAICDLRKAGYLIVKYAKKMVGDKWFTVMNIQWSRHFFRDIGIKHVDLLTA